MRGKYSGLDHTVLQTRTTLITTNTGVLEFMLISMYHSLHLEKRRFIYLKSLAM